MADLKIWLYNNCIDGIEMNDELSETKNNEMQMF